MSTLAKFAVLAALFSSSSAALSAWEPEKPVELVVPAGSGGRIDQMARLMHEIISKHKLMKQDLLVTNKSGGAGAEAFLLLKNGQAEPHRIMLVGTSLFTIPLATGVPFNWKDVSPVAMLALEPFILWTHSQAGYKSAKEYLDAAKAAGPGKMRMLGAGTKQEDQYLTVAIERATGAKFTYVPYKRRRAEPVLEGFDSALFKPIDGEELWRSGAMSPLCVFNNARLPSTRKVGEALSLKDIPSCKEAGVDVSFQAPNSIFMAPSVADEQIAYFVALFKKVVETPEWRAYMEQGGYSQTFMTGPDLKNLLTKMEEIFKQGLSNSNCGFGCK